MPQQLLIRGGQPGNPPAVPVECGAGGATVANSGPWPVYYRDEAPVSAFVNDGSVASGASVTLFGAQYLTVDRGDFASPSDTATLFLSESPVSAGTGGGLTAYPLGSIGATKTQAVTGDAKLVGTLTANATLTITGMVANGLAVIDVTQSGGPWTLDVVVGGSTVSLPVNSTGGSLFAVMVASDGSTAHAAALGAGPASSSALGSVKLAGDLGGSATAPTVPALTSKADLVGGLVPVAQLGSGTPTGAKFLRDDQTYAVPSGTGFSNPMTTAGDLIVGGASGAAARLAKGADSQVLTVDASTHLLAWKDPAAGGASAATAAALGTVKIVGTPSDAANPTVPATDVNGLVQIGQLPIRADAQKPTAALFESFSRRFAQSSGTFSTGVLVLSAIALPKGTVVTSISVLPTTTGTGTHGWAALYDNSASPVLLRQSTDDTSVAWTTNTIKTFTLSSTFTTTYAGIHYVGVMFVAGTMPTLVTDAASFGTANQLAPFLSNTGNGSLTTTAPNPATGLAAQSKQVYAYVS